MRKRGMKKLTWLFVVILSIVSLSLENSHAEDTVAPVTSAYPYGGDYVTPQMVYLVAHEPATIYCTVDGSDPVVPDSPCFSPFLVDRQLTLKFFSIDAAGNREDIKTVEYNVTNTGEKVLTFGNNGSGQLGDGTLTDKYIPLQVSGLEDIIAVAGGTNYTVALKNNGTVWAWGGNSGGQLGDGTTTNRYTPVQVNELSNVVAVAGGYLHTIALRNDGTVWTWGYNDHGQLGDGTTTNRFSPVQVSGLTDVIAIAGGGGYTIALKLDGTVWSWGRNYYGQLGDGTTTDRLTPIQVNGLTDIVSIAGGGLHHTIALRDDGTVWSWGRNYYGQLGDGTTTNRLTPIQLSGLTDVIAIAEGWYHTIALKVDGTVWIWGANSSGQLGDGTTGDRLTPIQVNGLTNIVSIAGGAGHTIALSYDGTVSAWGLNYEGQLGDGTTINRLTPVQISSLLYPERLSAGSAHSIALGQIPLTITTLSLPLGTTGNAYSQLVSATAGITPYTWSVSSGSLPSDLILDSLTGVISGTPTVSGNFAFTVQVTDSASAVISKTMSILIYDPLAITTPWYLPFGTVSVPYSQAIAVTGGKAPYTYTLTTGSLPPGLNFNTSTAVISGTPQVKDSPPASFTIQVADANSSVVSRTFTLPVYHPLRVNTSSLSNGSTGVFYSQTFSGYGGRTPYTWTISAGTLPPGLSLGTGATISGTPAAVGTSSFTVRLTDSNGTVAEASLFITITYQPPVITTASLHQGEVGTAYSQTLVASSGIPPYTWSIDSGNLPLGLTLNSFAGIVSGAPAAAGMYTFTIRVADAAGTIATRELSIFICDLLGINTHQLSFGTYYINYSQTLTATGGSGPYTWSIISGSLPPGTWLDRYSGLIWGLPSASGNYRITVQVSDSLGIAATRDYSITIKAPPTSEEWARTYGSGWNNYGQQAAVDTSGNVYVIAGVNNVTDNDIVIIKYDTSGNLLWMSTYNSGSGDYPGGITLDGNNNVYISGVTGGSEILSKCVTMKYDASGNQLWSRTYSGYYQAFCSDIAVDRSGNIYIAGGTIYNNPAPPDFLVVKYNSSGTLLWTRTYNRGGSDDAVAIDIDSSGNVYVAGISNNGAYDDIITRKYSSNGNLLWSVIYDSGNYGYSEDITVDSSGNSYVVGTSGNNDFLIKYSASGAQLWTKFLSQSDAQLSDITIGVDGIVYASGASNHDFLAVNFDAQGNELGRLTYDGGSYDHASGIAVDGNANIYLTGIAGSSCLTVKLNFNPKVFDTELPSGILNTSYNHTLSAFKGQMPYNWSIISGTLPGGLMLDASSGTISGAPTIAGNYTFTVQVQDAVAAMGTAQFTISILDITTVSLPPTMVNVPYSVNPSISGGTAPYTWKIASGSLPPALNLNSSTGQISGTPTTAGIFTLTLEAVDVAVHVVTRTLSITVYESLTITTSSLPSETVGVSYNQMLAASGGLAPYSWSGNLPTGLTINSSTGEISGVPKTPGVSGFAVQVRDVNAFMANRQFSVQIGELSCQTSPVRRERTPEALFDSVQSAYVAALDGDVFQTQAINHTEDLLFDRDISITLRGGFDCDYTDGDYYSIVTGSLIISRGTVAIENIIVQ